MKRIDGKRFEKNDDELIELLKDAMDSFARMSMFHNEMCIRTHLIGLQGQKKYNHYHEQETLKMIYCIQHYLIDHVIDIMYDETQPCYACSVSENGFEFRNVKEYLDLYLEMLEDEKECLSEVIGDLGKIHCIDGSMIIKEYIPCISEQIKNVICWQKDFENSGWDWAYIRFIDEKLHKLMKKKSEYCHEKHEKTEE